MLILKIKYHILAFFKRLGYRIIYGHNVIFGKGVGFRKGFHISIEQDGKIKVGDKVFFNNFCSVNSLEYIEIGDNTIFGECVRIYDHNHRFKDRNKKIMEQGYNTGRVKIGKDCWIGSNVIILKGVTIGDGVIIGAGCIINKDIPSYSVVRGESKLTIERRK